LKKLYGLIGFPLSHSFSKKYFADKFQREKIEGCAYELFEIENIKKVEQVFRTENLRGINVTIPYKHDIMAYLDDFDHSAVKVGAVNVVKIGLDGKKVGYNSDYYGFKNSLTKFFPLNKKRKAVILGVGGAAKAVMTVLNDLSIPFLKISRDESKGDLSYENLMSQPEIFRTHALIINTTPLGMAPKTNASPNIDYPALGPDNYAYDLIYNPPETAFLRESKKSGAHIKNGLEMLELQAEKSWEIWNA
jgi:shikimate dehydrogenase